MLCLGTRFGDLGALCLQRLVIHVFAEGARVIGKLPTSLPVSGSAPQPNLSDTNTPQQFPLARHQEKRSLYVQRPSERRVDYQTASIVVEGMFQSREVSVHRKGVRNSTGARTQDAKKPVTNEGLDSFVGILG